jgi:hypothetical protein
MRLGRRSASFAGILIAASAATLPAPAVAHSARGVASSKPSTPSKISASSKTAASKVAAKRAVKSKLNYQTSIDDRRATEIQAALIQHGYLSGQPTGHWDSATEAAMGKLQADNGWQTKLVPDSRALIKIGLGPNAKTDSGPVATLSQP